MKTFNYEIKDAIGIHARPAGLYSSKITLKANGKSAEATKLMMIMSLGVKHGQEVEVVVEGEDEETAVEEMKAFFEQNL